MLDCIFCKIVNKEIPTDIVFENENALVFDDIHPQAKVHMQVIPKKHLVSVAKTKDEDKDILADCLLACKKAAEIKNIAESGYKIITNNGENGGQFVKHIHFHVLGGEKLKMKV